MDPGKASTSDVVTQFEAASPALSRRLDAARPPAWTWHRCGQSGAAAGVSSRGSDAQARKAAAHCSPSTRQRAPAGSTAQENRSQI
ncbi:unnamed protein product [Urochloa humidicola]